MSIRNRMLCSALALFMCVFSLAGCGRTHTDAEKYVTDTEKLSFSKYSSYEFTAVPLDEAQISALSGYEKICENKFLELYFNKTTAAAAVADKRTGRLWFTNSPYIYEDTKIDKSSLNMYLSQLYVEYIDGQNQKQADSYTLSVESGDFSYKTDGQSLAVTYDFINNTKESNESGKKERLFEITLKYELNDESLVVSVPMSDVVYDEKMPPLKISLLPHFGAALNSEEGYLFVPDGSGAVIEFDENKYSAMNYYTDVYGNDKVLNVTERPQQTAPTALPVFGIYKDGNGVLAIIEDGDAIAAVNAARAGAYSSFNEVYASFTTFASESISVGSITNTKSVGTQSECYSGTLRVKYAFLSAEDSGYAGMASYYREYLTATGQISKSDCCGAGLNLELLGAADKLKSVLGIKYTGTESLTSAGEAMDILEELADKGVSGINLKYTGWFNGGLKQELPVKIKISSAIGGKKEFLALAEYAESNNVGFYPSVEILTAVAGSSGFNRFDSVSRQIDQKDAKEYLYDIVTGEEDGYRYIIAPSALFGIFEKFSSAYSKLSVKGLCISDIGKSVFADYTKNENIDRVTAANIYRQLLKGTDETYDFLMTTGGNLYSASYSDIILEAPFESSGFNITDRSIPFYQIVYHGSLSYSGEPLNTAYDYDYSLLKSIEYGGTPYFQLMAADGSVIKNTDYSIYCSSSYDVWKEQVAEAYSMSEDALKDVKNEYITGHEMLSEGVFRTEYENGVSVYVNYNDTDYINGNIKVSANDYYVGKGEPE